MPVCSGGAHDSMVVLKQETRFAKANDNSFSRVTFRKPMKCFLQVIVRRRKIVLLLDS